MEHEKWCKLNTTYNKGLGTSAPPRCTCNEKTSSGNHMPNIDTIKEGWILEAESYDMNEGAQINIRKYDIADWWLSKFNSQLSSIESEVEKMKQNEGHGEENIEDPFCKGFNQAIDKVLEIINNHKSK